MSDISELETRITTALERISSGLSVLTSAEAADPEELLRLKAELLDERTANAQLSERLKALKDQQETAAAAQARELDELKERLLASEAALAGLQKANAQLRENNAALRAAALAGVAEPQEINKSMMTELDATRAAQTADRVELDAVLSDLSALLSSSDTAPDLAATETERADA